MKRLKFRYSTAIAPWKVRKSKSVRTVIRVAIQCTGAILVDGTEEKELEGLTEIFAYLKNAGGYTFNHVCNAVDMKEIPNKEGDLWTRKDSIDILIPALETAEETLAKLEEDMRFLAREITSYNELVRLEEREVI